MSKTLEPHLSPEDAPWGRQVNERQGGLESGLAALERDVATLRTSLNGLGASHATVLGDTVQRRTFRSFAPSTMRSIDGSGPISDSTQFWTETPNTVPGPLYGKVDWGNPIVFTLDQRRLCYIEFSALIISRVAVGPSGVGVSNQAEAYIYVDGENVEEVFLVQPSLYVWANGAPGAESSATGTPRVSAMIDLAEGEHTLQGFLDIYIAEGQGSNGSLVSASGWDLKLEIGDPAEPDGTEIVTPSDPGSAD